MPGRTMDKVSATSMTAGMRYETEEDGKIIRFLFDRGELAQETGKERKPVM